MNKTLCDKCGKDITNTWCSEDNSYLTLTWQGNKIQLCSKCSTRLIKVHLEKFFEDAYNQNLMEHINKS